MTRVAWLLNCVLVGALLMGCAPTSSPEPDGSEGGAGRPQQTGGERLNASPLATPEAAIAQQIALIKMEDVEQLKACFTERLRESITDETVAEAKKQLPDQIDMKEFVHEVAKGESDGQQTAKITMKNGRTLTTMIQNKGDWLADTLWFQ